MKNKIINKYAVIINGDTHFATKKAHKNNVEDALKALKKDGFETFVSAPIEPSAPADHYVGASVNEIEKLIDELKKKIDEDDELVIYTTGHGDKPASICIDKECSSYPLDQLLDKIPFGNRTVIMDQCYGGNWKDIFLDDPKTMFISAGSTDEATCCMDFSPFFWSPNVKDHNSDGVISWQERYAYAIEHGEESESTPQFLASLGYKDKGTACFKNTVTEIKDLDEFKEQLSALKPGQVAIINFSTDWCPACKKYKSVYDKFAKEANGKYLFLYTENEDILTKFKITTVPFVTIVHKTPHSLVGKQVSDVTNLINEVESSLSEEVNFTVSSPPKPKPQPKETPRPNVITFANFLLFMMKSQPLPVQEKAFGDFYFLTKDGMNEEEKKLEQKIILNTLNEMNYEGFTDLIFLNSAYKLLSGKSAYKESEVGAAFSLFGDLAFKDNFNAIAGGASLGIYLSLLNKGHIELKAIDPCVISNLHLDSRTDLGWEFTILTGDSASDKIAFSAAHIKQTLISWLHWGFGASLFYEMGTEAESRNSFTVMGVSPMAELEFSLFSNFFLVTQLSADFGMKRADENSFYSGFSFIAGIKKALY